MVLGKLGSSLKETLSKIARSMFVDEKTVNELVKEIQRSLLQSDVNVELVFELTKRIKERALKEDTKVISKRENLVKIVYEELVSFLGDEKEEIKVLKKKPFKIMMIGVYGSGKTTTIAKLANYYNKIGYKIATLGLDVHRAAAFDQLEQLSNKINVRCFIDRNKDPIKIYKKFENEYKNYDILIIDTAGRDALDDELIKEIKELNNVIEPDEKILIVGAEIGQVARELAEGFKNSCGITGIIVSKLDGTAKGGGALSSCVAAGAKIKFIGTGEKIDDLEVFNPKGFVSRLLGMGDLEALLEKAKEAFKEEEVKDIGKRLMEGDFNLVDLYDQMQAMKKMGPLSKVMEMVPGFSQIKLPKDVLQVQEDKLKKWKFILDSCKKEELERPLELMSVERINRIAKGSGTTIEEVRELLKQYKQSKKVMRMMKGKDPEKMMKRMGKFKLK